nr:hypothetical protein [Deltaproteobacteria bacterium]
MPRIQLLSLLALCSGFLTACAEGETEPFALEEAEFRCPTCPGGWGPPVTNTHGVNGLQVSALDSLGQFHDGWRLAGVIVLGDGGTPTLLNTVSVLPDGDLFGEGVDGETYTGSRFIGSKWVVSFTDSGFFPKLGEPFELHDILDASV